MMSVDIGVDRTNTSTNSDEPLGTNTDSKHAGHGAEGFQSSLMSQLCDDDGFVHIIPNSLSGTLVYLGHSLSKTQLHVYRLLVCSCGVEWKALEECENFPSVFQLLEQKLPKQATSLTIQFLVLLAWPIEKVQLLRKYEEQEFNVTLVMNLDLFLILAVAVMNMSQPKYKRFMELARLLFLENYHPTKLHEPEILLETLFRNDRMNPKYLQFYLLVLNKVGCTEVVTKLKEFCECHKIEEPTFTKIDDKLKSILSDQQDVIQKSAKIDYGACSTNETLLDISNDRETLMAISTQNTDCHFKKFCSWNQVYQSCSCRQVVVIFFILLALFSFLFIVTYTPVYAIGNNILSTQSINSIHGSVGSNTTNLLVCLNRSTTLKSVKVELMDQVTSDFSSDIHVEKNDKLRNKNQTLATSSSRPVDRISDGKVSINYYYQNNSVYVSSGGILYYELTNATGPSPCGAQFFLFASNESYQSFLNSNKTSPHFLHTSGCIPTDPTTPSNYSFNFSLPKEGFYFVAASTKQGFKASIEISGLLTHYEPSGLSYCHLSETIHNCTIGGNWTQSGFCILSKSVSTESERIKVTPIDRVRWNETMSAFLSTGGILLLLLLVCLLIANFCRRHSVNKKRRRIKQAEKQS